MTTVRRSRSTRLAMSVIVACAAAAAAIAGVHALRATPAEPDAPRAGSGRTGSGGQAQPARLAMDTPLGTTDVERDVAQLIAEYLADEPAADARYRGKTVAVRGIVLGVDRSDPELVTLAVGKQLGSRESNCACQLGTRADRAAPALAVAPGQAVTVRGKFAGMVAMRMVLLNCELARR